MDLSEAWKKLEVEKLNKPVHGTVSVPDNSKHPVSKLIAGYNLGLWFIFAFEGVFLYLLIVMPQTIVKVGLMAVIIIYLVFLFIHLRVLKKMKALYTLDTNTHKMLSGVLSIVEKSTRFQQRVSWGFFPICTTSGFLLGISINGEASELIIKPKIFLILLITIVIMTPSCYVLTKWMNKIAYGKYCDQIKMLLKQMEEK